MTSQRQIRVLIIEDDDLLAEMVSAYLTIQGYVVQSALSGFAGIKAAHADLPDVIILDIRLPDIDGFQVYERLQTSHVTRNLPLIFLTELDSRNDRIAGLKLGAFDYITKPFDLHELGLRVANILARSRVHARRHPVTGLPVTESLETLRDLLASGGLGAVAVRLLGVSDFRDRYGFVASDNVLYVAASALAQAAYEYGGEETYCCHLDEDLFVLALPHAEIRRFCEQLHIRLDPMLPQFYPSADDGFGAEVIALRVITRIVEDISQPMETITGAIH